VLQTIFGYFFRGLNTPLSVATLQPVKRIGRATTKWETLCFAEEGVKERIVVKNGMMIRSRAETSGCQRET
jgi:hypothetical protein